MTDEPRRSGRATKGQHTKTSSSSPAPAPKPAKSAKTKPPKKSLEPSAAEQEDDYDEDDGDIRCVCGNDNPKDKRAFIGCDECGVWQHNVCMGIDDEEGEQPDSYLCEQCGPEDHKETLQAMERGETIWEARNKIYQSEKKMSKNRKQKRWLKKDVPEEGDGEAGEQAQQAEESQETGSKRKRGQDVKEEAPRHQDIKREEDVEEKPTRSSTRQDKRRKSSAPPDPETALVEIDQLPIDRQKIATALSKILAEDVQVRSKAGAFRIPDGHTSKSLGDYHAVRIEYALKMNHGDPSEEPYKVQFRTLHANLKKNKMLIERLLQGTLTPDNLSTMTSSDMASDELQKERAAIQAQLDRQNVALPTEGPKYRRTHKGDELIEDENAQMGQAGSAAVQPVRERTSVADAEMTDAGSPPPPPKMDNAGSSTREQPAAAPLNVKTQADSNANSRPELDERRSSSQQFDMGNIWARAAHSPTHAGPRPMQMPPRRRSSVQRTQHDGTKDDADVDRMLQDDEDDSYSPADYSGADAIVWRGKLIQSADSVAPTMNARFVAGRDISPTVSWRSLLPDRLSIDGRLVITRAEEYLCSLQWSQSSDVSVLALTPYDDAEGFEAMFSYFKSRQRYGVVKSKPNMIKDLYIIPIEHGQDLPEHVGMLEFCRLKAPAEEKCLLATVVINRAPGTPTTAQASQQQQMGGAVNGQHQQTTLPQHMRSSVSQGPSGSPLNTSNSTFSPPSDPPPSYSAASAGPASFPPNPYSPYGNQPPTYPAGSATISANPLVAEILGQLQFAPTAQQVVAADPNLSREKLENLRRIMEDDPDTRTDLGALSRRLVQGT